MSLSTTAIGKAFELHSLKFLNHHLLMSLQRVGGTGDQGIDLRGWWWLPSGAFRRQEFPKSSFSSSSATATPSTPTSESSTSSPNSSSSIDASSNASEWDVGGESSRMARLRVVAQCKAETKTLGSRIVRELEGVMAGLRANSPEEFDSSDEERALDSSITSFLPSSSPVPPVSSIAVLLSQSGFSRDAISRALQSPSPMMLVHLPGGRGIPSAALDGEGDTGEGMKVIGCLWNNALSGDKGLLGPKMQLRREMRSDDGASGEDSLVKEQWRCWFDGKRLGRLGPSLDEAAHKT